ncbi:16S rRNA (adenine(1518)-N(6)/adenine(1519)-N(6))-dimethyltransferase RsmA [Vandammella animalimorsus]|uniref:Ribosomal RNA small subunit methyltransferase A n=1 Tax=Vandammella animalimorsus TaxID=2029117 RepID=A0A2A2AXI5_9BURK|nr:16S rRNA (adenine(1518)-N(6)/adenine(1519)-N(6))-dimethyltransferase RsmA [Vandammella animalimorsus]PAT42369.1 16S rRNA (adenine(1518)-N(6)/adenine(1519)-N(6))-dimethyltransferase [Vandammella animalimorsus]
MRHIPRKRFGQHFLIDDAVIARIVSAIDPQPQQAVVEIGPGMAALTAPLLERLPRLTVIELDRDLVVRLRLNPRLHVVASDVLQVNFTALAQQLGQPQQPARLRVVGNLPYNISSPLLFHLLGAIDVVQDQHFMLQKEVIDRMLAQPGSSAFGRLSVMLQWRYAMERILDVPPAAFDPPPKVDSAVVRMVPRSDWARVPQPLLEELVKTAFSQKRKLVRHTLGKWLQARGFAGPFDLQRRAEEIPVHEYTALAAQLAEQQPDPQPGAAEQA